MDGVHDLGGLVGFGPIVVEPDEPTFHQEWEGRVFAMAGAVLAAGGFGTPQFRHAIERMDGTHYLSSSYYEHWLTALGTLAVEADLVDGRELVRRSGAFPLSRPVHPDPVPATLAAAASTRPRFAVGALVRVRNLHPRGHTRCPDYVRDRVGEVVRVDPDNPVPEIEAHLGERILEPTYCVAFSSAELWGGDAADSASVRIDLYERYLEEA